MNKSKSNHAGPHRRRSSLRRRRSRKVVKRNCRPGCGGHRTKRTGTPCSSGISIRRKSNRRRSSRRRSLRGGFVRQHSVQQFMTGARK